MTSPESTPATPRARREPPRFRAVTVRRVSALTPRMVRITLAGTELEGFAVEHPAASVRLLLPSPGSADLVVPAWNGNEFLLPDGRRPTIRTFTPRRADPDAGELDLEIVVHGGGAASEWAAAAAPGAAAAISGPGRGYSVDPDAPAFLLAGDETAIPAISQLLEALPAGTPVEVHVEVADPGGRLPLPDHAHANVEWHDLAPGTPPGDALVAAVAPPRPRPRRPGVGRGRGRRRAAHPPSPVRGPRPPAQPQRRSAATGSTAAAATPATTRESDLAAPPGV